VGCSLGSLYNYISEETPSPDRLPSTLQDAKDQLNLARTLFPLVLNSTVHQYCFEDSEDFQNKCNKLRRSKEDIWYLLNGLRILLISDYSIVEAGYPRSIDTNSPNNDIYDVFTRVISSRGILRLDFNCPKEGSFGHRLKLVH
jgi:hypothetical protein